MSPDETVTAVGLVVDELADTRRALAVILRKARGLRLVYEGDEVASVAAVDAVLAEIEAQAGGALREAA